MNLSGRALLPTQVEERLSTKALRFALPYLVIQGEQDTFTPTGPAVSYFEKVVAPAKRLVILPNAGHFALVTNAEDLARALVSAQRELSSSSR